MCRRRKRKQRGFSDFSEEANKRIQRGMEVLNDLAKSLERPSGPAPGPSPGPEVDPPEVFDEGIVFDPSELVVQEDDSSWASINVSKDFFSPGDSIVIESDSKNIIPSNQN